MVSGVRCRVSAIRGQRSDDSLRRAQPSRRQMKNLQDEPTFLSSVIRLLTPDTRHLTPVLLKKKIITNAPYFVNYLRDATLGPNISYLKHPATESAKMHSGSLPGCIRKGHGSEIRTA